MIRKWMATLLALMLAVMVPVCAMADRQHTLTVIPGDVLAATQAFADLADVLSLTCVYSDEAGALSAALSGEEMLTISAAPEEGGLYLCSELLGDEVLYIDMEEVMAMFMQLAEAEMGEEFAEVFKQSMEAQTTQLAAAPAAVVVDPEESLKQAQEMFADDPGMLAYIERVISEIDVEEGSFAASGRDTATGRMAMNLTEEDLLAICDSKFFRTTIEEAVKSENPELAGEELEAAVNSTVEEVRQIYANMDMEAGLSVYTVDDFETIVGLEMYVPMTIDVEGEKVSFVMQIDYNRLTDDGGVSYKANVEMGVPEEDGGMITVLFDHYKGADEKYTSEGLLGLLVDDVLFTITYDATTTDYVRTRLAGVYYREGATAIIKPAASERPLISFQVVSKEADPSILEKVESATTETAVDVLKLSEEGLNELMTVVQTRALQLYSKVMTKLPDSVLELIVASAE